MRSATPKVLHPLCGRTMLGHAVAAARAVEPAHLCVVVGHGRDLVVGHLAQVEPGVVTAVQDRQLGTGHAVRCALEVLPELEGTVVVTYGDVPLLRGDTLVDLVGEHDRCGNAVTVLTAVVADPTGYGRVLRASDGSVAGIVEHKDATDEQREVAEINSGIYAFDAAVLRDGLGRISSANAQGELYLTDVLAVARHDGRRVSAVRLEDVWQTEGVNDRVQLARMRAELNRRVLERWMREGVSVEDPASTWVDVDVVLARDVTLRPGVHLESGTTVAEGATIGPDTTLAGCVVGADATVLRSHCERAQIGPEATVGPFTFLRPAARLGRGAKAGAYVEIKSAVVGDGSKVPHLSYVGDADIGVGSNIGAATVFVNYDGIDKHRTTVGDHVRIGSDTMLVAPVTVGDGAYTAAGSVITADVPPGAMAVARGRQRTVEG
ncbi:MAG: bifunctional UDP-N-acetylglucosamine diphosphorylase/glucosamine-1-phosphate N-acetyltransferase GlmU, partial [Actinomycetota bacterium]|nr:bifunctional UDP-N-acetylglucosamine diphosphorylase/glucosamine-1-phosphate N-acetyltransferase GlmU [Actinomycetota bacterium]